MINRGAYMSNWWKSLGQTVAASGTESLKKGTRIFDTANPGTKQAGNSDLGALNERCNPAGPSHGEGGEPGQPGINCKPLGNALIIQEDNNDPDIPDNNAKGGTITLEFPKTGGKYVSEIRLLGIDEVATVVVANENENGGLTEKAINVPILGKNSFHVVRIDSERVKSMKVIMMGSGAVTFVSFCSTPILTAPPARKFPMSS